MCLPSLKIEVLTHTGVPPFFITIDELLLEGEDGLMYGLGGKVRFLKLELGTAFLCENLCGVDGLDTTRLFTSGFVTFEGNDWEETSSGGELMDATTLRDCTRDTLGPNLSRTVPVELCNDNDGCSV